MFRLVICSTGPNTARVRCKRYNYEKHIDFNLTNEQKITCPKGKEHAYHAWNVKRALCAIYRDLILLAYHPKDEVELHKIEAQHQKDIMISMRSALKRTKPGELK